jgi:DNA-binding NtrC family response regulator
MSGIYHNRKNTEVVKPKILVIDDEKLIRWSLKEILTQEGYDVDTADRAEEAINMARDIPYSLIIADIEIHAEDGMEMLKKIEEFRSDAIAIILSARPKQQIPPEFGGLRVFDIIEKPFKSEQLLSTARKALDSIASAWEESK